MRYVEYSLPMQKNEMRNDRPERANNVRRSREGERAPLRA